MGCISTADFQAYADWQEVFYPSTTCASTQSAAVYGVALDTCYDIGEDYLSPVSTCFRWIMFILLMSPVTPPPLDRNKNIFISITSRTLLLLHWISKAVELQKTGLLLTTSRIIVLVLLVLVRIVVRIAMPMTSRRFASDSLSTIWGHCFLSIRVRWWPKLFDIPWLWNRRSIKSFWNKHRSTIAQLTNFLASRRRSNIA